MRLSTLNSEELIRFLENNIKIRIQSQKKVNIPDNEKQHHLPY